MQKISAVSVAFVRFIKRSILVIIAFSGFVPSELNGQNTIFWSVRDTSTGHQSYLLGTFHQMGNHFADRLTVVIEALLESELGIFESLGTPGEVQRIINARSGSETWTQVLHKSDVTFLTKYSESWPVDIDKVNPGELYIKLQQDYVVAKCGTVRNDDEFDHFDNYLVHLRSEAELEKIGLETDSIQTLYIADEWSTKEWSHFKKPIHKWVRLLDSKKPNLKYCSGSMQYRAMRFNYNLTAPCPDNVLITQRNTEWMKTLPELLHTQNCFVAVGLLHLFNECGLITSLRKMGFLVDPIIKLTTSIDP
jgi:uncharacterized protein YbaP (TraB family)